MKGTVSIKTKEFLNTGLLGISIIMNGIGDMMDGQAKYIAHGIAIICLVISFAAMLINTEPWDEMCRENWREASVKTVNLITIAFMLYGVALMVFKNLQPEGHGFVLIMVGVMVLTRLAFFLHYEKASFNAEEE